MSSNTNDSKLHLIQGDKPLHEAKQRYNIGKPGEQHYLICGRWFELVTGHPLATPPTPDKLVEIYHNECIAIHPAMFSLIARQTRQGFSIVYSMGITKDVHDFFKAKEAEMAAEAIKTV